MPESNCTHNWEKNPNKLLDYLDSGVLAQNPKVINFYIPSFIPLKTKYYHTIPNLFQTFSITGSQCKLKCNHCGGKILGTMQPATTPKKLFDAALKLKKDGGIGFLISGGCQSDGSIPIKQFIPTIAKIKRELDLIVFVHTGIMNFEIAKELKKAKVDLALIDVIGSETTIKKLDINLKLNDYIRSLRALQRAGLSFVPHVIVGLDNEKLRSEFNALKIISSTQPSAIVIIAFMPIRGTNMARIKPSDPEDIAKVLVASRLIFPKTAIALGCMRQRGEERKTTEIYALKAGVAAIAYPTEETIKYAKTNNYKIIFQSHCCAQIFLDYIP
ncbi:MAG: radical SAM protein [Candidatus Bathyarchaeota archaeon]|nr:radical SAM protein [Candidatus Bathyarchaeota archaeon]